jgi:hypothetical protein
VIDQAIAVAEKLAVADVVDVQLVAVELRPGQLPMLGNPVLVVRRGRLYTGQRGEKARNLPRRGAGRIDG